jgi:serine/threonine protein kinase
MITPDGTAKLLDFGLARTVASRLTAEGEVIGTVYYIAPEQALGQEVDGSADLYALGVLLYELTTGRLPFKADDPVEVISQHLYAPVVSPREHNQAIPSAVADLIVRLLSKEPKDRPASAAEVERTLARLIAGER